MNTFETIQFHPRILDLDPSGPSRLEGWKGFRETDDGILKGIVPTSAMDKEVARSLDRVRGGISKNIHKRSCLRRSFKENKFPHRGYCYRDHLALTAWSGLPLIYREGWCLDLSKSSSTAMLLVDMPSQEHNNRIMRWQDPTEEEWGVGLYYHGWTYNTDTGKCVDITVGKHNGMRDGILVPICWENFGNSAKQSAYIARLLTKQALKHERKFLTRYDVTPENWNSKMKSESTDWSFYHKSQVMPYTRRGFYHGLKDICDAFHSLPKSHGLYPATQIKSCAANMTPKRLVESVWRNHPRAYWEEQWRHKKESFIEPVPAYFAA